MTPLPKNLEEMREKQAEIADTKDYSGCSDSGIVVGYRKGFNQAASIMLKDMESMTKALEKIENLLHQAVDLNKVRECFPVTQEALKIWREKYGGKK